MPSNDHHRLEVKDESGKAHVVTREELYVLVWCEPMLRVAARYGVSSSYMARVCDLMRVPRPKGGHWSKLSAGKKTEKPALPDAQSGDEIVWNQGRVLQPAKRPLPRAPTESPKRQRTVGVAPSGLHPLIRGAKGHFEGGRTSRDSEYLKPAKRLLVDLVVSKRGLGQRCRLQMSCFICSKLEGIEWLLRRMWGICGGRMSTSKRRRERRVAPSVRITFGVRIDLQWYILGPFRLA